MSVQFTWLGHSAFAFDFNDHKVLLDPFLTDNPLAAAKAEDVEAEIIFLTHAHGDHASDVLAIAKRTGAKVVSNFEIAEWASKNGVDSHGMNTGGGYNFDFVHAKQTIAFHSSSFPDGSYGGNPNGFIFTLPTGERIYFAGDTALFSDMKLIGEMGIDVAFLPIGDNFTMGPDDALQAIGWIKPKYVVPMHYNTFPAIVVDVAGWANRVSSETEAQPIVLDPGGTFKL
ncbi:MAG: metal-dependent hydrolase [Anaerolineaceae bacterium]|nr:metal-dependent hydrolase [Anaerolineaceae bacterium]